MTDLDRYLPLRAVDFHLLLALTQREMHGYGLVKEIESSSRGRVRLEPGNLYRHIRRLVDGGLVEPAGRKAVSERGEGSAGERRRYYRATALGRDVLAAEANRMRLLAAAASRVPLRGDAP